jgi:hypothetical protein
VSNDFKPDLEYSLEERDNELFDNFYKRIFPGISKIEFCEDLSIQKTGVDKIIHFAKGNKFTIDEKKRRIDYNDIALELWSNYEKRKRGWLYYSTCDYIVYAIMPSLKVYLLPTILLKRVWYINQREWAIKYPLIFAQNTNYRTQNICIPTNILLNAISGEMSQKLNTS